MNEQQAREIKQVLYQVGDILHDLDEQEAHKRVYGPNGREVPQELFKLKDAVRLLQGVVAAQYEEIKVLRERLGS